MAIKINFDAAGNPEHPTLVLSNRSGNKIGQLNAKEIHVKGSLNNPSEISFNIYKYVDGQRDYIWDKIRNFKLIWCKEWDVWFETTVEVSEERTINAKKTVYCTRLGQAELSQVKLHNIEINTENDIARDDYIIPTTLYNSEHPEASLLHRILEKVPHYSISHVDSSIAKIQRTFTFDDITIYDALNEIAQEIGCLFIFPSNTDESGHINRTIEVYDLESNCLDCGYRGEFSDVCPECGSKKINEGYGEDTTIFVTADELADSDIQFTTDTNSVKNCFKLEAGDDLMTATIRNCNPNGSDYIWYITEYTKEDMSDELVDRLDSYDKQYNYYQKEYIADIDNDVINKYNKLVAKYHEYNSELEQIVTPIVGYSALMTAYYNTIDLAVYLQSALMPNTSMSDTNAELQAALLSSGNLSPIAVTNINTISIATANNALLGIAKAIVDARYRVKVNESNLSNNVWTGNFTVTNYSDEEDTAISHNVIVAITDDYETYVKQKIDKSLAKEDVDDVSISGLFDKDYSSFCEELKKYSLSYLNNILGACQSCIDILIEQGIGDSETWYGSSEDLYNVMYVPYYDRLTAIESEIKVRQDELDSIVGTFDEDGSPLSPGMQTYITNIKNGIQEQLDFENYLGKDLWLELCAYRREDKYSNSNYVSDGLNNAELFANALEFLRVVSNDIYKSAELQHSISTNLKNLLVIDKFKPFVQYFEVGNWIRVRVDDNIYKLRLIDYEIDYNTLSSISVGFSDVFKVVDGTSDLEDVVSKVNSMAPSYDSVQKQASKGYEGSNTINDWFEKGLDATNVKIIGGADNQVQTWDEHGMLFRRYEDITDSYSDTQLKVVNSTIVITDDGWKTVKAALGRYFYYDPVDKELKEAYGVNGETIVGKLLLGENLGIYSDNNSLTFDRNGLVVTNGINSFTVNPNSYTLLSLSNNNKQLLYATDDGDLVFTGRLSAATGSFSGDVTALSGNIGGWTLADGKIYGGTSSTGVAVMQVPKDDDTWVFASGGKSHDSYDDCPFKVNRLGELYATTGIFGNIVSNENGTFGNFDNGLTADTLFELFGEALQQFDELVVRNITAENIKATNVFADYITASEISAMYATIGSLNATNAEINNLKVNKLDVSDFTAEKISAMSITVQSGNVIGTFDASIITSGTINSNLIRTSDIVAKIGTFTGDVHIGHVISTAINSETVQGTVVAASSTLQFSGSNLAKRTATLADGSTINYVGW